MKAGSSISKSQLDSACVDVQAELSAVGLWNEDSRLTSVECFWCYLPQITMPSAHGFFIHECEWLDDVLGYEPGHMYIPQWVLSEGLWQNRGSLRDVVRHEYGHAVAHYYPALIRRSQRFTSAFGERYDSEGLETNTNKPSEFVTSYALTNASEDFAETFMMYLRYRGKLPIKFNSVAIKRKWKFIANVSKVISLGRSKW